MKKHNGFTLIEVLVALAIIGIALTAIIKSAGENIKSTQYLQQKMIASWVAERVINEARIGLIKVSSDETSDETEMLDQSWIWKAKISESSNPRIKELHVSVFKKENDQEITQLVGYLYAQK